MLRLFSMYQKINIVLKKWKYQLKISNTLEILLAKLYKTDLESKQLISLNFVFVPVLFFVASLLCYKSKKLSNRKLASTRSTQLQLAEVKLQWEVGIMSGEKNRRQNDTQSAS